MKDYLREMCSYPSLYYKQAKVKKIIKGQRVDFGKAKNQFFLYFKPNHEIKDKVIVFGFTAAVGMRELRMILNM